MYVSVQKIFGKSKVYGYSKDVVTTTLNTGTTILYGWQYSSEKFERENYSYKIVVKESYRDGGKVKQKKDLGIGIVPATYMYCENLRDESLDDVLLQYFISSNMHTRSSVFYLARAWEECYFGDSDKAAYYMDKFVNEGEQIDKEFDNWIREKKAVLNNIRNKKNFE